MKKTKSSPIQIFFFLSLFIGLVRVLELENLSVKYKTSSKWNLKNISFSLEKGQLVVFAGKSGSGKSTLAQAILGLIPKFIPAEIKGKILINGVPTENLTRFELIRTVGYIPQYPSDFITNMLVEEEIAFPLENLSFPREIIHERISETVKVTEVDHLKNRIMTELSSGEIQRVELCLSLICYPKILVLDEPMARIDPASEIKIAETLKKLAEKGHLVIVFEHRLDYLFSLADKIYFIENGTIIKSGKSHELISELTGVDLPEIYLLAEKLKVEQSLEKEEGKKELVEKILKLKNRFQEKKEELKKDKHEIVLNVEDVSFRYNRRPILENINFEIYPGNIIGLLGINGSGKSTLLRLISGILKPNKGKVLLFGNKIKGLRHTSKYVAYVPENAKLFLMGPTPLDDIKKTKVDLDIVKEELSKFGFWHLISRKLYHMSEGERRILAIYTAFLSDKRFILLDEPTIGLDEEGRNLLYTCIERAKKEGKIVIIATNDQRILPFFDKLVVIEERKIALKGTPQKILYELEKKTKLVPNQLVRFILELEESFKAELPHIITVEEISELALNGVFDQGGN